MTENKSDETIKAIPTEDVEVIPPGKNVDKPQKDIPIETLISLRNKGHTLEEIAKIVNCCKQNVHQRLEAIGYSKERVENFKENRADVFCVPAIEAFKLSRRCRNQKAESLSTYCWGFHSIRQGTA